MILLQRLLIENQTMEKQVVKSAYAPEPIGPYSQAVKVGNLLFVSGQVAMDPESGELQMENITAETRQIMKNLETVLRAGGAGFENVVKTSIFLKDMSFFNEVNEEYGKYFTSDFPARETVAVRELPRDVNVEISMIAAL